MLNPIWLKTFVTLVDTGHFTQTAEKLFMTQPGVSQHINKLEQACGHSLLKREKKSFVITEQGKLVYEYVKKLVLDEQALIEQMNFDNPYSGECTFACSGSVALLLYPKLLKLQAIHPELVISLKAAPNYQILAEVKEGSIDQGIVTDIPNESFFDVKQLGQEPLCLVTPLSIDNKASIKEMLMELGVISHPDVEHYLSLYCSQSNEQELQQLDINSIPVRGFINQISQILQPIAEGIGFTVLPKSAVDSFHNKKYLKIIAPKHSVVETLYLVKKKNRSLPARFKTFNSVIENVW
ncbi:LysR family transcriptional regulator [Thalassotalea sp. G2M2-11]|uniref:LysR substrate-binding domain-containing protein n=1 Tax=Thalassotalea sp. G2M2-11 TaxID=2787627 RepID=UPI0019D241A5